MWNYMHNQLRSLKQDLSEQNKLAKANKVIDNSTQSKDVMCIYFIKRNINS